MAKVVPLHKKDIPVWHLLPFSIYVVLNGIMLFVFQPELPLETFLDPLRFLLFGLATYRIADIIANEQVTKVFRAPFINIRKEDGEEEEVPKRHGFKQTLGTLLYCPSCVGVWVATGIVYGFIYSPQITWIIVAIFSLSALERFFFSLVQALVKIGE